MKTNTKIVQDKIRQHILDQIDNDIPAFIANVEAVKFGGMSTYTAICNNVDGGNFLIYNADITDFLNSLDINPNKKEFDNLESWNLYRHLIAANGEKLINSFNKNAI
jgi:hypothetical protein